jgi:hypothetical protein
VAGNHAYVADEDAGLQVIDVSNPTNCVRVGGCDTSGSAYGVAVAGNHAYVADGGAGLQMIDMSNPTNCVRVWGYNTGESTHFTAVTVNNNRIYVADLWKGLVVLASLPNVQFTLRVDASPNVPFTIEGKTNVVGADQWTPLLTTNVATMPFDFVDFDVRGANYPQKFYRAHQP